MAIEADIRLLSCAGREIGKFKTEEVDEPPGLLGEMLRLQKKLFFERGKVQARGQIIDQDGIGQVAGGDDLGQVGRFFPLQIFLSRVFELDADFHR